MPHQSNSQAMTLGIFLVIFSHSLKKCIVSTLIFSASTSKVLGKKLPHLSDLLSKLLSEGHLFLGTVKTKEIMNPSHLRKNNCWPLNNDAQENCYYHGHFP